MVLTSVSELVEAIREVNLLRTEQFQLLESEIAAKFGVAQDLAKHLAGRGWITPYQADELLNGRGSELLLGSYLILDTIGEGGMGKVFKANQLRLSRLVAIKVVHPDLLVHEMALKRFRREATAAAQLSHPNIVRLYDADQAGGRHFLVMEYVSGIDLSDRVAEAGRLSVENACDYVRQAAIGLQHAHDLGLVHRDIKPGNLLLTIANPAAKTAGGVIKILDMGLARISPGFDNESDMTALTQEGAVIGTPDYMSPEQAKNGSDVDARSDLYSLGCTLYFLLTARPPFRQGTTLERLLQHQMDQPPHIQMFRPDVPNEVAKIIHILLAKRPDDRFQSGLALAEALEPWCFADRAAQPPSTVDSMFSAVVRQPTPVAALKDPERTDPGVLRPSGPAAPEIAIKTPSALPQRKQRWRLALLVAIFVGAGLIVGGIISAGSTLKKLVDGSPGPAQTRDEHRPQPRKENDPPLPVRKLTNEPLDAFLPADTELIAILNVRQLSKSEYFAKQIKPKFEADLKDLLATASFDPLTSIDLVILAIPAQSKNQAVIVVQGSDFITSDLLNWVGMFPGVEITPSPVPGQGTKDVYRLARNKSKGEEDLFGAILSINPSRVVLSPSKARVIEALGRVGQKSETKFEDPTIQSMLAGYSPKPVGPSPATLWMALGVRGKRLEPGSSGGVQSIIGTLRLDDDLDFDVTLEASNRMEAVAVWSQITQFARDTVEKNPGDKRVDRIASLLLQAIPAKVENAKAKSGFVGKWSLRIESEKLPDWCAPFFQRP